MRSGLTAAAAIVCAMSAIDAVAQSAAEATGFVTEVTGSWIIHGASAPRPAVRKGPVFAGERLELQGGESGRIVVALYTGELKRAEREALDIPARKAPGPIDRIMQAIETRFQNNFVRAAARGGLALRDAVLRADAGSADLTPVFQGAEAGSYSVALTPLDASGNLAGPARDGVRVAVDGGRALTADPVDPGLYLLDITSGPAMARGDAVVLVQREPAFANSTRALSELESAIPRSADLDTSRRGLVRAYLAVLAESGPP